MSEIFGFVNLNGEKAGIEKLSKMQNALRKFPSDSSNIKIFESSGMGFHQICVTPESKFEKQPLFDENGYSLFTATARLDNRDELCDTFGIADTEKHSVSDPELIFKAWQFWEKESPQRLFGDWSFSIWNERKKELFVARDHLGNTGLYYFFSHALLVFASNMEAVLAHPDVNNELDELQFGYFLVTHTRGDLKKTLWRNVFSLLPGHCLTVNSQNLNIMRFWNPEDIIEDSFYSTHDYLEVFLELFRRAVSVRLRSIESVATTLSAGLDSSSVTALAAEQLDLNHENLAAFTSIPIRSPDLLFSEGIADEFHLAHLVAEKYPNIIHYPVCARLFSPIAEIRRSIQILRTIPHALSNLYWINALLMDARNHGCKALLTGQMGNSVVSWDGGTNRILLLFSKGMWQEGKRALIDWKAAQGKTLFEAIKSNLIRPILSPFLNKLKKNSDYFIPRFSKYSVISPYLANKTGICDLAQARWKNCFKLQRLSPDKERQRIIELNSSITGPFWHASGSFFGIEVRDPTVDLRLLEFCLRIPNNEYNHNGNTRAVIRRAMNGIIPDEVRLNQIRGKQSADFGLRMLNDADEVEKELKEMENSKLVKQYIEVSTMREIWESYKYSQTSGNSFRLASYFLRGIAGNIFLKYHFPEKY
ncbi:MAG: hypothetical protein HQM10_04890 [Candidatus Riflebacteria bacterium]|nr:hypothetical protein [Candidatus Riflebacteria bacterium]